MRTCFLFQYTKQHSIPVSISNWFITASTYNEVMIVLRDMLYAYWKDYNCTLDYYIFHLFFSMLSKEYPEEILAMPYGKRPNLGPSLIWLVSVRTLGLA